MRNAGLLGPSYKCRGTGLVSRIRGTDLALLIVTFEKWNFRNASLVILTFRFPNADFICLT